MATARGMTQRGLSLVSGTPATGAVGTGSGGDVARGNASLGIGDSVAAGRFSLGLLAALVVGAIGFYYWTRDIQGGG